MAEADNLLEEAVLYLSEKKYKDGVSNNRKRQIRAKAAKFVLNNDELYYNPGKGKEMVKYIKDKSDQLRIARSCHVDPTSGHLGIRKTLARIRERFMWKGVWQDVKNLVSTCNECQRTNRNPLTIVPELHSVPVHSPWHHVGIDFIGPIHPVSKSGNKFVLTLSDYFTKWVEAIPLPSKCATGVAKSLFQVFMRMGLPKLLTSDQGGEFKSGLEREIMKLLQIKRHYITPYHPQANGLDERWNQTLKQMIVKFTEGKKDMWDEYLPTCVFAYNTAQHDSTLHSPFEIMFGRIANLPVDLDTEKREGNELLVQYQTSSPPKDPLTYVTNKRKELLTSTKNNIQVAQKRQKEQYDRKHHMGSYTFSVGMKVLKRDFRRKKRKGGAMDYKWLGPYVVTKDCGKGFFSLKSADTEHIINRIHGAHLKVFHTPANSPAKEQKIHTEDLSINPVLSPLNSQILELSPSSYCSTPQSIASPPPLPSPLASPGLRSSSHLPLSPCIQSCQPSSMSLSQNNFVTSPRHVVTTPKHGSNCLVFSPNRSTTPDCVISSLNYVVSTPKHAVPSINCVVFSENHVLSPINVFSSSQSLSPALLPSLLVHSLSSMVNDMSSVLLPPPKKILCDTDPPSKDFTTKVCINDTKEIIFSTQNTIVDIRGHRKRECDSVDDITGVTKKRRVATCPPNENDMPKTPKVFNKCIKKKGSRKPLLHAAAIKDKKKRTRKHVVRKVDFVDLSAIPSSTITNEKENDRFLSQANEDIITKGQWLNDCIINSGQYLLKLKFPHWQGLQNVNLGNTLTYNICREEFVQVLNVRNCHWITIYSKGVSSDKDVHVLVYDSMSSNELSSRTKEQIASICNCTEPSIKVTFVSVQQQTNSVDCGLFALAFATALCYSEDPSCINFVQHRFRSHLLTCLNNQDITPFPSRSRKRTPYSPTSTEIPVYCHCRLPPDGRMVECAKCLEWVHEDCEVIPEIVWKCKDYAWKCRNCR